jgi:hypothetical protein
MKPSTCASFALALHCGMPALAATNSSLPPLVTFTAEQDRQNMMDQLGIQSLRPGANGNPLAKGHANYDEAVALRWGDIPPLMTLKNGQKVTTSQQWQQRRAEIVEDFEREVVGRIPAKLPKVNWIVQAVEPERIGYMPVIATNLIGKVDNSAYPSISVNLKATLVLPANTTGPVPVLIMFGRAGFPAPAQPSAEDLERINAALKAAMIKQDPSLRAVFAAHPGFEPQVAPPLFTPVQLNADGDPPNQQELIAAGWGFVALDPISAQADDGAGLTRGIIGLVNRGQPRKPEDWGALRAWGWAAGRVFDYLETNPAIDIKHIGIDGVSRYGKAALVTMAFDRRFAMVLVGSSGEGGAKLYRHDVGETVENLTAASEYHWMAGNFLKYGAEQARFGRKDASDLPVDAHELIALCAPRLTFISYGMPGTPVPSGDALWVDQVGSYMATVAAQPSFEVLDAKGLGVSDHWRTEQIPAVNTALLDGELAWRQHDGGHTDTPNMKYFIAWVEGKIHHTAPASE